MSRVIFASALVVAPVPTVTLLAARFGDGERRSHFWVRVVIVCLAMPAAQAVLIAVTALTRSGDGGGGSFALWLLLLLLSIASLMFVEAILFRASDSRFGGGGDSGGLGPDEPPTGPDRPSGELPLPDSDVGRWRVRDHDRPDLGGALPRRRAREPERVPAR